MSAKATDKITTQDLLRSLRSTTCPACSMNKAAKKTLCMCCF